MMDGPFRFLVSVSGGTGSAAKFRLFFRAAKFPRKPCTHPRNACALFFAPRFLSPILH